MKTFRIAKVLFKSMFKKPATLMYPEVPREWQERTRGSIDILENECILCGICGRRCPADAIEVDRKGGTWTIHRMQCVQCGECVSACPKKCLDMNKQYTAPETEKVVDTYEIQLKKDESKGAAPEGDLTCDKDTCVYCGLCAKVCPADALKVDRKEKVWEVDKETCVKCGACVDKCPKKCLAIGAAADDKAEEAAKDAPADADDEKLMCNLDECIYCGLCAKNCPCDALEVDRKAKTWKVDHELCVKCEACLEKCPKKCLTIGAAAEEAEEKDEKAEDKAEAKEEAKAEDKAEAKAEDNGEAEVEEKEDAKAEEKADDKKQEKHSDKSIPVVDEEKCIYCNACANECPSEAISAEMDDWKVDEDKCIGCAACIDVCPAEALEMKEA